MPAMPEMPEATTIVDRTYRRVVPMNPPYIALLDRIHRHLVPRTYVEIGVLHGHTLALALPGTTAIGVDPAPSVIYPLQRRTRVFKETSDDFFDRHDLSALLGGQPLDLAFIDGMHHFEFALRDLINLERYATADTTILVHDCYPFDEVTAARERTTKKWSGDVWKLIVCLKQWRPDLRIAVVDVAPTGLGVVRGLDASSTVLSDHYDEIVASYLALPFDSVAGDAKRTTLNGIPSDWDTVRALLPARRLRQANVHGLAARRAAGAVWWSVRGAPARHAAAKAARRAQPQTS